MLSDDCLFHLSLCKCECIGSRFGVVGNEHGRLAVESIVVGERYCTSGRLGGEVVSAGGRVW